ncbi:SGNH/GDSL hydrolase family protein [Xanthobacter sp. ZOL 2024]
MAALLVAALLVAAPARACPPEARPEPPLVLRAGAVERLRAGLPLRILAIGSSSTAGVGASRPNLTFPAQLADRLGAALGEGRVEVTNAGVSGESSPATLKRLQAFLQAPEAPDLVIWQVGTNDVIFGGTPERLATMVTDGLAAAQAADVAVMVVDQQYFRAILSVPRYEQFVAAVNSAAQARGITVLGRYRMMKAWAAADPKGFRALFAWDGFHMNDAGYACLAQLASEAVLEAVDGARAGQSPGPGTAAPLPLPPPREIR